MQKHTVLLGWTVLDHDPYNTCASNHGPFFPRRNTQRQAMYTRHARSARRSSRRLLHAGSGSSRTAVGSEHWVHRGPARHLWRRHVPMSSISHVASQLGPDEGTRSLGEADAVRSHALGHTDDLCGRQPGHVQRTNVRLHPSAHVASGMRTSERGGALEARRVGSVVHRAHQSRILDQRLLSIRRANVHGARHGIVADYPDAPPPSPAHFQGTWVGATGNGYPGGGFVSSADNAGHTWFSDETAGFDLRFKTFVLPN